jgi:hypothetical protein
LAGRKADSMVASKAHRSADWMVVPMAARTEVQTAALMAV